MFKNARFSAACFLMFILIISGAFSGCGNGAQDSVVATVCGDNIEEKDIEDFLKLLYLYMPASQETYSQEEYAAMMKEEVLWYLIESKVVANEVKRLGLEIDGTLLEQNFRQVRDELVGDIYGSEEDYQARLGELKLDEESIKDFHRRVLLTEVLYEHLGKDVTEEEARAYVAENPQFLEKPAQIYAFHILLEDEEKALDVLELLKDGADFLEVGKEHSLDDYVELGIIRSHDMFDPDFLEAAFKLKPGEISMPVETAFGFHIIKITEKEEAGVFVFEEIREDIIEKLKGDNLEKYFLKLMEEADIETFEKINE